MWTDVEGAVRRTLVWFSYLQTNGLELVALVALYIDNLCLGCFLISQNWYYRVPPKI